MTSFRGRPPSVTIGKAVGERIKPSAEAMALAGHISQMNGQLGLLRHRLRQETDAAVRNQLRDEIDRLKLTIRKVKKYADEHRP